MLGVMFSEKFDMKPAEDDAFFIDRDGTHFSALHSIIFALEN